MANKYTDYINDSNLRTSLKWRLDRIEKRMITLQKIGCVNQRGSAHLQDSFSII